MYSQSDTPKHLFDSSWKSFGWILRLSCSKTNKFSSTEGESSGYENRADSFEAILKCTRIVPESGTPILAVYTIGTSSTADYQQ